MISIFHGENQPASRNALLGLKNLHQGEIIELNGAHLDITDLVQAVDSPSLFGSDRLVIVDNLLSPLKPGKKRDMIIAYLADGSFSANLALWEKGSVGRKIIKLKKQKHVTVQEYHYPTVIFSFVDSLVPHNAHGALEQFHRVLQSTMVPEVIFTMIVRQFRLYIALTLNSAISESKRLAPWQRNKLQKIGGQFEKKELFSHYKDLLIIDYQVKSGRSALDLTKRIEQFIISL